MMARVKQLLKNVTGAGRPGVIAVVGLTRGDAEAGVAHALTGSGQLPIHAWCAEPGPALPIAGCDVFTPGANASQIRRELSAFWPALTIVSWKGERGDWGHKLLPFTLLPFRIVVANEAGGFFAAKPGPLAEHIGRRAKDNLISGVRRLGDWCTGGAKGFWYGLLEATDRVLSFVLLVLGFLAKCTPPLVRAAVRSIPAGDPSKAIRVDACGSRYTEIIVPGRSWPGPRVRHAVLTSGSHFVVFRRLGEKASAEPLITLARESGSFAVANQIAYAGWRKTLITRHPFRRLQPGEVSQVMAPWSSLIVVRVDLMQRLGVPHALTFGGALAILYWKAAAAGLKSLVVGQSGEITQEPAMELEDAEFALRLVLSHKLSELAAERPQAARGNVAMSPAHRKPFRSLPRVLPRVLIVSPYLPFPLSHGGAVRMYNLCRAMSGQVDFVLACFREAGDAVRYKELHEVFREVYVVDIDEKHPDKFVPRQVAGYRNSAMSDLIRSLCLNQSVDLVQLEYTQMAEFAAHTGRVPVILVEHDLTFTLHKQLAHTESARREYELWHVFERAALQCSNAVWMMSGRDREIALEHGAPPKTTVVVPNGVDLARYQPISRQTAQKTVLFVGSFRHLPNLLAYETLRHTIMPEVWKVLPDVKLSVIAGPMHEKAAQNAKKAKLLDPDPRIQLQGFVEDVRPAYQECDVVVIPLPVSAGTNIKLMEAMACARAVVSTAVGCQGLGLEDETDLLVREIGFGFSDAIIRLFQDDELRNRIATRSRYVAETQFSWDSIAEVALESYETLRGAVLPNRGLDALPVAQEEIKLSSGR
jgi:glycosyltransferase involved in cell wall biosynthesis